MECKFYTDSIGRQVYNWECWTGCRKCSRGCLRCFVAGNYNSRAVIKQSRDYRLPIRYKRDMGKKLEKYEREYMIPSGSIVQTCNGSDFFIHEADCYRTEAWEIIHTRNDCMFEIETKRPERIEQCLPDNWLLGWNNVEIGVSCEDNIAAALRIPELLNIETIKHKVVYFRPLLEYIDISKYINSSDIEKVVVGGETGTYNSGLKLSWVQDIAEKCSRMKIPFIFCSTGSTPYLANDVKAHVSIKDEQGMAKFYSFDTIDLIESKGNKWRETLEEQEARNRMEEANRLYKKIKDTYNI